MNHFLKGVMRETNMSNDKETPNTEGSNRSSTTTDPNIMELDSDSDMDDLDYDPDDEHAAPQSDEENLKTKTRIAEACDQVPKNHLYNFAQHSVKVFEECLNELPV